ncbi:hypothetical protein IFM89_034202 [Coptis chinensis]|uniref:Uncharacterized protein n=1 Tax=Coptis chinensis TaxID=261450 RepID=A0A835LFY6_9MAGN|nr:hypothetical protein IFM89_034202 [Coptis chinensis]
MANNRGNGWVRRSVRVIENRSKKTKRVADEMRGKGQRHLMIPTTVNIVPISSDSVESHVSMEQMGDDSSTEPSPTDSDVLDNSSSESGISDDLEGAPHIPMEVYYPDEDDKSEHRKWITRVIWKWVSRFILGIIVRSIEQKVLIQISDKMRAFPFLCSSGTSKESGFIASYIKSKEWVFYDLQCRFSKLSKSIEEDQAEKSGQIETFGKTFQEESSLEEKQALQKIVVILGTLTSKKTEMVSKALRNMDEENIEVKKRLEQEMSSLQEVSANAKAEWHEYFGEEHVLRPDLLIDILAWGGQQQPNRWPIAA